MIDGWLYTTDGKTLLGPVSFDQLQQLAKQGLLEPSHHVRQQTESQWRCAETIPELFAPTPPDIIEEGVFVSEVVDTPVQSSPAIFLPILSLVLRRLVTTVAVVAFLLYLAALGRVAYVLAVAYQHDRTLSDLMICFEQRRHWAYQFLPEGNFELDLWDEKRQQTDFVKLKQLFPDKKVRDEVLTWGKQLALSWGGPYKQQAAFLESVPVHADADQLPAFQKVMAVPISERLAGHAVWRRLLSAPGASADDLAHLKEVVENALPDEERRRTLVAWTKQRRQQKAVQIRSFYFDIPSYTLAPPPPNTAWFDDWILYDDWAVTDEVFAARKAHLLGTLGGETRYGRDLWQVAIPILWFFGNAWYVIASAALIGLIPSVLHKP